MVKKLISIGEKADESSLMQKLSKCDSMFKAKYHRSPSTCFVVSICILNFDIPKFFTGSIHSTIVRLLWSNLLYKLIIIHIHRMINLLTD
ncbi:hypothetical protein QL285_041678 [Trifolium repens]|nr:hypothetical protein QL285_041678 [Trifolium repens]